MDNPVRGEGQNVGGYNPLLPAWKRAFLGPLERGAEKDATRQFPVRRGEDELLEAFTGQERRALQFVRWLVETGRDGEWAA